MIFSKVGLQVPKILLPNNNIPMQNWAVIACDQYTSDRPYWQRLADQLAGQPSTLNMIFPEVYLEDDDVEDRIAGINKTMEQYLADGSLVEQDSAFILIDRKTSEVPSRKGLIVALDLEQYDYNKGAQSLIRATEGTILDRLPPRIKVRQNAPIELPHIMVLIDDPERSVIEPLFQEQLASVYDFELLAGGGHLKGYRVDQPALIEQVVGALEKLADPDAYHQRYDCSDDVMLYAMGDGNHSFATAKAIWEKLKADAADPQDVMDHPARYALVELVNLHDAGLEFEAIHRVLFNVDAAALQQDMSDFFAAQGTPVNMHPCPDLASAEGLAKTLPGHVFVAVFAGSFCVCQIAEPKLTLAVASLQEFLDGYLAKNSAVKVDYIHGTAPVTELGSRADGAGFYLPSISKGDLFRTIVHDGALPRKTFSMGEADEKRFYLECRKIR